MMNKRFAVELTGNVHSHFKLRSSKDFPLDWIFVFLQILALTEPIMCIDWILLACLHLQMEACVLFYPEKATGFCVCQHIKKGDCDCGSH